MPQRKGVENNLYLLMRKDDRLFPGNVKFRHLDIGHGIRFDVLAVGNGPAHGIIEDRENRLDRRARITILLQAVDPVLDFRRRQRIQSFIPETGTNMPFNDSRIGIVRIGP